MREIKFRAWNKKTKRFFKPTYEAYKGNLFDISIDMNGMVLERTIKFSCNTINHDNWILMQFTGLKDKNDVDIYEGDIVECTMGFKGGTLPHMGEIVYMEEFGAFATENQAGKTLLQNHHLNSFTVIGNIHESPELLENLQ